MVKTKRCRKKQNPVTGAACRTCRLECPQIGAVKSRAAYFLPLDVAVTAKLVAAGMDFEFVVATSLTRYVPCGSLRASCIVQTALPFVPVDSFCEREQSHLPSWKDLL